MEWGLSCYALAGGLSVRGLSGTEGVNRVGDWQSLVKALVFSGKGYFDAFFGTEKIW